MQINGRQVIVNANLDALSRAGAQRIIECADEAIRDHGAFYLALSGGSTPRHLHQVLSEPEFQRQMEWSKVHIYFGDERNVPYDHTDSNYKMAMETLLSSVPVPADQIFPMPTCCEDMQVCARRYAKILTALPNYQHVPCFDMVLLGMGDDGHTASLFPGTSILTETSVSVAAVYVPKLDSWRVSLTYPVLNQARHVIVLVSGSAKADVLRAVFYEPEQQYPIQGVVNEHMQWFIDTAAAARIVEDNVDTGR